MTTDSTSDSPPATSLSRTEERKFEVIRLGSIDLRGINARLETDEGDLILVIGDEDREIEFTSGLGGSWDQAIEGAERVADLAHQFADTLRLNRTYVRPPSSWPNEETHQR